jgi:hypothetical protein
VGQFACVANGRVTLAADLTEEDPEQSNLPSELVGIVGVSTLCCWLAVALAILRALRRHLGRLYGALPIKEHEAADEIEPPRARVAL